MNKNQSSIEIECNVLFALEFKDRNNCYILNQINLNIEIVLNTLSPILFIKGNPFRYETVFLSYENQFRYETVS